MSYQTKLNQKVSSTKSSVGGATAERADFKNLSFLKLIDKSSPQLSLACAEGRHIDNIKIEICRAGGDKIKYFEYNLSNCLISCIDCGGGRGEFPAEVVYVDFGKIEWTYAKQNRTGGSSAGNVATGWNLQKNSKI